MDISEANYGSHIRCISLLSEEDLGLSRCNDLMNQYKQWLKISKENRNTRSANRKADAIYEDIMSFKLKPIKRDCVVGPCQVPKPITSNGISRQDSKNASSSEISIDSGVSSSQPVRSLRPRSRTPEIPNKLKSVKPAASPCTPTQQSLRAHLKRNASNSSGSGTSNVLSAALKQQHPSVSVTKIRQLLTADSAQKKREEEKERQERLSRDRKAKEERAEAQKKQLLEERAINAKLKREQRLLHAAEVRKARAEKAKEESKKAREKKQAANCKNIPESNAPPSPKSNQPPETPSEDQLNEIAKKVLKPVDPPSKTHGLNETFKKPAEVMNIVISSDDETTEGQKAKPTDVAYWAKAPLYREKVVKQYSRTQDAIDEEANRITGGVYFPVDLIDMFRTNRSANRRYSRRTSSAVWSTPPSRGLKRLSSSALTPNGAKRN